jgi:hypothetical protein
MRNHSVASSEEPTEDQDNLLFWPLGQMILATTARSLLDDCGIDQSKNLSDYVQALKPLSKIQWELNKSPWLHFLLTPTDTGKWKMRDTDRQKAQAFAISLIMGLISESLDDETLDEFRKKYFQFLIFDAEDKRDLNELRDKLWGETLQAFGK